MRIRVGVAVAASLMVLVAAAAPVAADTIGNTDADRDRLESGAEWTDGDATVSASVSIVSDAVSGEYVIFVNTFRTEPIVCPDESTGFQYTEYGGEGVPDTFAVDKKLASASGSGTVTGTRYVYDDCGNFTEDSDVTVAADVSLTATGAASTSTSSTKTVFPDGTRETIVTKYTSRAASGHLTVAGSGPHATAFGEIAHLEQSVKTK
jgi:hypothetical protein